MKSLFAKFKISAALDTGSPLPSSLERRLNESHELRDYAQASSALHRSLKGSAPAPTPPFGLHRSIMRAVMQEESLAATPTRLPGLRLRWLAASALVLTMLLGVWHMHHRTTKTDEPSLATAAAALDLGQQAAQTMPAAVVAPLSDEWQRVNRDLETTADFLLASLP